MKKIMLQLANLQLSRSQMKEIRGGYDDGSVASSCKAKCKNGTEISCGPCGEGIKCYAQDHDAQGGAPLANGGCHCGTDSWSVCENKL